MSPSAGRSHLASVLLSGAMAVILAPAPPVPLSAQEQEALTADEEVEKRAREAEEAPIFQSDQALTVTLSTDIERLRKERPEVEEVEGTLSYTGPDGTEVTIPVKVRTRGHFRRQKRNCNFPPLRLNFASKQVKGTLFEGQDKLKLVTPCRYTRDNYQEYVLQEYLIYRVYATLTPLCFRVRLLNITYEDTAGGDEPRAKQAFLIEDDDRMAERNRAALSDWNQVHPRHMDGMSAATVALFQYMIGNTDWSAPYFHNVKMVRTGDARYVPVPYDFDFSGVVNARYATPDPILPIRNVRERVFRGFCRQVDHQAIIGLFNEKRDEIWALYEGFEPLSDKARRKTLDYFDSFYRILNDPKKFDREILRACRDMPS